MNIALIGPSGVGKGTHAAELGERYNMQHLVTGDLLRQELDQHTAVGFLAERHIQLGLLVPDEVVDAVVAERLWKADPDQQFLFDGFPRTAEQALFLDQRFSDRDQKLDGVIYLQISDEAVENRLIGRLVCNACHSPYHIAFKPPKNPGICDHCGGRIEARPDDIKGLIRVRLRAFRRVLEPVLDYYRDTNRLVVIDGDGSVEEVGQAIDRAIQKVTGTGNEPSQSQPQDIPETIPLSSPTPHQPVAMLTATEATHPSFDLVLIGGPGSGKGTQAEQLQMHLGLLHIASGDLFRDNMANQTELGELAKSFMDRGELVPDDVTEAMVEERITRIDAESGFILDGFPRTISQAYALTEIMNGTSRRVDGVIYIRVSDEEIVRRLSGRLICRTCHASYHIEFNPPENTGGCDSCGGELYQREDDSPNTVHARLKVFHAQTAPVISYYRDAGLLVEIDGEGVLSDIALRVLTTADRMRAAIASP